MKKLLAIIAVIVGAQFAFADGSFIAIPSGIVTTTGALKGNGAGVVSQAASTDLSDTTAETTWTPTDQSGAALSFTVAGATFSKGNKTCVGNLRLTFPATGNGGTTTISLPCTMPNTTSPAIGACYSTAISNTILVAIGTANTATAQFWNISGAVTTNVALTGAILSCNFAFNSQ